MPKIFTTLDKIKPVYDITYKVVLFICKTTAADMPNAVSTFLETPKNGQIPKNCDNTMLFTKIAEININIYSIIIKLRIKN